MGEVAVVDVDEEEDLVLVLNVETDEEELQEEVDDDKLLDVVEVLDIAVLLDEREDELLVGAGVDVDVDVDMELMLDD